jgi:hypothetical protein
VHLALWPCGSGGRTAELEMGRPEWRNQSINQSTERVELGETTRLDSLASGGGALVLPRRGRAGGVASCDASASVLGQQQHDRFLFF